MTSHEYLKAIEKALLLGNATEPTHRPSLKAFVESLDSTITATNEPKRVKCGAPGYVIGRGETPLGYIEPGSDAEGRVWINKTQYIEGVSPQVWAFHIGGYQVCQKWLKDRKGRQLTYDDLTHYQRVVSALSETMRLMAEIDRAIEEHGGWPVE